MYLAVAIPLGVVYVLLGIMVSNRSARWRLRLLWASLVVALILAALTAAMFDQVVYPVIWLAFAASDAWLIRREMRRRRAAACRLPPYALGGRCPQCFPGEDGRHSWSCPEVPAHLFVAAMRKES